MESPCVGCLVEIEVAAKNFIGTFATEHHLYSHAAYDTRQ